MVIYLAALQDVPRELLEASSLDGANAMQKIWNITLPMISPVILFNVIVGLIAAFQFFTQVHVMTDGRGSPADSTLMMSIYLYQSAFEFFKMGYASAQAWILFLIIVIFTMVLFRVSGRLGLLRRPLTVPSRQTRGGRHSGSADTEPILPPDTSL